MESTGAHSKVPVIHTLPQNKKKRPHTCTAARRTAALAPWLLFTCTCCGRARLRYGVSSAVPCSRNLALACVRVCARVVLCACHSPPERDVHNAGLVGVALVVVQHDRRRQAARRLQVGGMGLRGYRRVLSRCARRGTLGKLTALLFVTQRTDASLLLCSLPGGVVVAARRITMRWAGTFWPPGTCISSS